MIASSSIQCPYQISLNHILTCEGHISGHRNPLGGKAARCPPSYREKREFRRGGHYCLTAP
eukprot:scaffold362039_cov52-Prasinocladus_malaysianus.AAC.1